MPKSSEQLGRTVTQEFLKEWKGPDMGLPNDQEARVTSGYNLHVEGHVVVLSKDQKHALKKALGSEEFANIFGIKKDNLSRAILSLLQ